MALGPTKLTNNRRTARVNRLLLDRLDLEGLQLLIEDLAQVHDDAGYMRARGCVRKKKDTVSGHVRRARWHCNPGTPYLSWIFCHKWARKIWMSEILSVGILPCMKMPVRSSCTWKPT